MSANFEEQFLLVLAPYDRVDFNKIHENGRLVADPKSLKPPIANADEWTRAVRDDIIKISKTQTGMALLRALHYHGQVITIRPRDAADCNARVHEGADLGMGRGVALGTGADIIFNPASYAAHSTCHAKHLRVGGFRVESHEVLLHELVHALRNVSGKYNKRSVAGGLSFYTSSEEFNAVLIQGIYASERKQPVRGSHYREVEIEAERNGSFKFFQSGRDTYTFVANFCQENPGFTKRISQVRSAFNPIKAYYRNPRLAAEMTKTRLAQSRDKTMPAAKAVVDFLSLQKVRAEQVKKLHGRP